MTVIQGGFGALDMPLTPEVFAPPKGGVEDCWAWIAAREQLLATIQNHGHKALFPDLDGEYFNGLHSVLASRAKLVGDDAYAVLFDLLLQVEELAYRRPLPGFASAIDADDRSAVGRAIAAAHGAIATDVLADCAVAQSQEALQGLPCPSVDIPNACNSLAGARETAGVRLCNAAIVDLVFPLASRFEFVAVTGQYLTPDKSARELSSAEIDFVKKLLKALLQQNPLLCKRFQVHFVEHRPKVGDRSQPPKQGASLQRLTEVAMGPAIFAGLEERGVQLEIFQWAKKHFPFSKDRHLVVGDIQSSRRGLWITHLGNDACDKSDVGSPVSKAIVMEPSEVTAWHTGFRAFQSRLDQDDMPERLTWAAGEWLEADGDQPR